MKPFNQISLLAAVLLLADCDSKQTKGEALVELSISSKVYTDKVNSSTVFSSVKCVPLETNRDVLIDNPVKIVHQDGFIYVADRFALYRFDEEGRVCGKIRRNGPGPEEYSGIADFEVNADQTVWILSRTDRTLYKYTWDGVLEKTVKMNYWAARMYFVEPEKVCVYIGNEMDRDNRHQLKTVDLHTNSVTGNHLEIDSGKAKFLHIHSANHFSRTFGSENEIYVFNMFDDVIHKWANDELKPVFRMNINHKNIPQSLYENDYADVSVFFQALFKGNYAYGTGLFIEYEKDFLYAYFYDGECHFALISGETRAAMLDFKTIIEDVALSGYPVNLTEQ
ncbi:MAG: 6-bladed beta-propeller, partial [Tannerella sp.]|nr:6-bladed beta-propeller [Tannerella sp.]